MLSKKTEYLGQKTYMSFILIDSHMLDLRKDAVVFEFEYRLQGRESKVFEFSYTTVLLLLDPLCDVYDDDREDGLYPAEESRMLVVVSDGMAYKYGERELAAMLFRKMH